MKSILVVEDNPHVRRAVADSLKDVGHAVAEVARGAEALDLVQRRPFDLVLVDYLMPDMKGDEVARHVQARRPGLPVAYLTAYADFMKLTGKARDAILIPKPIGLDALVDAVDAVLGGTYPAGAQSALQPS